MAARDADFIGGIGSCRRASAPLAAPGGGPLRDQHAVSSSTRRRSLAQPVGGRGPGPTLRARGGRRSQGPGAPLRSGPAADVPKLRSHVELTRADEMLCKLRQTRLDNSRAALMLKPAPGMRCLSSMTSIPVGLNSAFHNSGTGKVLARHRPEDSLHRWRLSKGKWDL
jgi:hypothetical protein